MKLTCPTCGKTRKTGSALYWHGRKEHELSHEMAYDNVSDALAARHSDFAFENVSDEEKKQVFKEGGEHGLW